MAIIISLNHFVDVAFASILVFQSLIELHLAKSVFLVRGDSRRSTKGTRSEKVWEPLAQDLRENSVMESFYP